MLSLAPYNPRASQVDINFEVHHPQSDCGFFSGFFFLESELCSRALIFVVVVVEEEEESGGHITL
jgi:hypothetical protein